MFRKYEEQSARKNLVEPNVPHRQYQKESQNFYWMIPYSSSAVTRRNSLAPIFLLSVFHNLFPNTYLHLSSACIKAFQWLSHLLFNHSLFLSTAIDCSIAGCLQPFILEVLWPVFNAQLFRRKRHYLKENIITNTLSITFLFLHLTVI